MSSSDLLKAIDTGNLDAVKELLSQDAYLLSAIIRPGPNRDYSPVTEAAVECQLDILAYLIECGCDVAESDDYPLKRSALYDRCVPAMEMLVKHGADVNSPGVLVAACEGQALASMEWLLNHGAKIVGSGKSSKGTESWNAFSHAGHFNKKCPGMLALLLEHGADVNEGRHSDTPGSTALHNASRQGDEVGVRLLLSHGADVNIKSSLDVRPVDVAKNKKIRAILEKHATGGPE